MSRLVLLLGVLLACVLGASAQVCTSGFTNIALFAQPPAAVQFQLTPGFNVNTNQYTFDTQNLGNIQLVTQVAGVAGGTVTTRINGGAPTTQGFINTGLFTGYRDSFPVSVNLKQAGCITVEITVAFPGCTPNTFTFTCQPQSGGQETITTSGTATDPVQTITGISSIPDVTTGTTVTGGSGAAETSVPSLSSVLSGVTTDILSTNIGLSSALGTATGLLSTNIGLSSVIGDTTGSGIATGLLSSTNLGLSSVLATTTGGLTGLTSIPCVADVSNIRLFKVNGGISELFPTVAFNPAINAYVLGSTNFVGATGVGTIVYSTQGNTVTAKVNGGSAINLEYNSAGGYFQNPGTITTSFTNCLTVEITITTSGGCSATFTFACPPDVTTTTGVTTLSGAFETSPGLTGVQTSGIATGLLSTNLGLSSVIGDTTGSGIATGLLSSTNLGLSSVLPTTTGGLTGLSGLTGLPCFADVSNIRLFSVNGGINELVLIPAFSQGVNFYFIGQFDFTGSSGVGTIVYSSSGNTVTASVNGGSAINLEYNSAGGYFQNPGTITTSFENCLTVDIVVTTPAGCKSEFHFQCVPSTTTTTGVTTLSGAFETSPGLTGVQTSGIATGLLSTNLGLSSLIGDTTGSGIATGLISSTDLGLSSLLGTATGLLSTNLGLSSVIGDTTGSGIATGLLSTNLGLSSVLSTTTGGLTGLTGLPLGPCVVANVQLFTIVNGDVALAFQPAFDANVYEYTFAKVAASVGTGVGVVVLTDPTNQVSISVNGQAFVNLFADLDQPTLFSNSVLADLNANICLNIVVRVQGLNGCDLYYTFSCSAEATTTGTGSATGSTGLPTTTGIATGLISTGIETAGVTVTTGSGVFETSPGLTGVETVSVTIGTATGSTGQETTTTATAGGTGTTGSTGVETTGTTTGSTGVETTTATGESTTATAGPTGSTGVETSGTTGGTGTATAGSTGVQTTTGTGTGTGGSTGSQTSGTGTGGDSSTAPGQGGSETGVPEPIPGSCLLSNLVVGNGMSSFPAFQPTRFQYYCSCVQDTFLSTLTATAQDPWNSSISSTLNEAQSQTLFSGVESGSFEFGFGNNHLLVRVISSECTSTYNYTCYRPPLSGNQTNNFYNWWRSSWTGCMGHCNVESNWGEGIRQRTTNCRSSATGEVVEDSFCTGPKPSVEEHCEVPCSQLILADSNIDGGGNSAATQSSTIALFVTLLSALWALLRHA